MYTTKREDVCSLCTALRKAGLSSIREHESLAKLANFEECAEFSHSLSRKQTCSDFAPRWAAIGTQTFLPANIFREGHEGGEK